MEAYRKRPSFYGKDSRFTSYLFGAFAFLFGVFCVLFCIFVPKDAFIDWFGCLLGFALGLVMVFIAIFSFAEGSSIHAEKRSWFETAVITKTAIIEREEVDNNSEEARIYGEPNKYWHLKLKMIPSQLAILPDATLVSVDINESQYKKYAGRKFVTIYHSIEDPFTFLLGDEI
jgi:hypothetical protein